MSKIPALDLDQSRFLTLICFSKYAKKFAQERAEILLALDRHNSVSEVIENLNHEYKKEKVYKAIKDWNEYKLLSLGLDGRGRGNGSSISLLKIKDLNLTQLDLCIELEPNKDFEQRLREYREAEIAAMSDICWEVVMNSICFIGLKKLFGEYFDFSRSYFRKNFYGLKISFFKSLLLKVNQEYNKSLLEFSDPERCFELMQIERRLNEIVSIIRELNTASKKDVKRLIQIFLRKFPDNHEEVFTYNLQLQAAYLLEHELRVFCALPKDPFGDEELHGVGRWASTEIWCQPEMDAHFLNQRH